MSIASQLQAIKSVLKGKDDPIRRPISRPSIIFDPKTAADIDIRSIFPLAESGLDALIEVDDRFKAYKATLFSHATLDIDREKMAPKEEEKLNKSICSYLQLLAGHFHLPASLKTLEYLIRRYQVHVFNVEELVLCALPYHDTHAFVQIIQLMDFGNKKWAFLEGVKTSGAPPPRRVIVEQCIRDKGVLEALCNYASPAKKFQHSRIVICFCTAVTVEVLGSIPKLDTDTLQRILTFVFNGLNPAIVGSPDHTAGALMVVGLIATRSTLSSKLVQNLVIFIARFARHEATKSSDLQRLRVAVMAIVTLVQSQSFQAFPKKTLMILKDIRDFVEILFGLSQEFNIRKFLHLYVESLIDYSSSEDCYYLLLVNVLEALPVNDFVEKIVHKILVQCMKLLHADNLRSCAAGVKAKQILAVIDKKYPAELRGTVNKFLEDSKLKLGEEDSTFLDFCRMLDGNPDIPMEISDSKVWFSLEHPKAAVRRATLLDISSFDKLKSVSGHPWKLVNFKDAIVHRLLDDDLTVVQAALSINGLSDIVSPPSLLKAYHDTFLRCICLIRKSTKMASQACDVAVSCLERMVLDFPLHKPEFVKEVAGIIFPALLVLPQTWRVNIKALEIVNKLQWPSYSKIKICDSDFVDCQVKSLDHGQMTSLNIQTIQSLAETFAGNPLEHIEWLVVCSRQSDLAKCLFLFIVLQALVSCKEEIAKISRLFKACFAALKDEWYEMLSVDNGFLAAKFLRDEWCEVESQPTIIIAGELNLEQFDKSYKRVANQLLHLDADTLSKKILISINWCLLEKITELSRTNKLSEDQKLLLLDQLFLFFSASSSMNIFKKQLPVVVKNCCNAPFMFLSNYFVQEGFSIEIQAESLFSFASICSMHLSERKSTNENVLLSLVMFPSLLVPLASVNKEIRIAAINCIDGMFKLWQRYDVSRLKNGNDGMLLECVSTPKFGDFLESIVNQKRLILSDVNFLSSFLISLLNSSSDNLVVPYNSHKRFDQPSKDAILLFILKSALKFPSYGKQKVLSLFKAMGTTLMQVEGTKDLLFGLLQKRNESYIETELGEKLSKTEIETLCLLLELCATQSSSTVDGACVNFLVKGLKIFQVESSLLGEPAILKPCITVLKSLTTNFFTNLDHNIQDEIFMYLVLLFRCDNGDIRYAAREAVLNLNINSSTIVRTFEEIISQDQYIDSKNAKRKKSSTFQSLNICTDQFENGKKICVLGSLLDILLLKKDIDDRGVLVKPLFAVLGKLFSYDWLGLSNSGTMESRSVSEFSESLSNSLNHVQQSTLLVLKAIIDSLLMQSFDKDDLCNKLNINLLVECAHSARDIVTRNHIFSLLSSVAKISSEWLSEHIVDLFLIIGESSINQGDFHSQQVLENLISVLFPCWLSKTNSVGKLFQIFINSLPHIAEHRKITLMMFLLRTFGEKDNLGVLYYHLFHSLTLRLNKSSSYSETVYHELLSSSSMILKEWEYTFALQLCNQYSSEIWLPSLVKLLQEIEYGSKEQEFFLELFLAVQFIFEKLRDTQFVFELESGQDASYGQVTFGSLMEQVVLHFQLVGIRCKQLDFSKRVLKDIRKGINRIIKTLTTWMKPETFFKSLALLLGNDDENVITMTLGLLCKSVKDQVSGQKKDMKRTKRKRATSVFTLKITPHVLPSFIELCSKINQLISCSSIHITVKLAAISSIETLAKELHCDDPIFASCLQCVVVEIDSSDLAFSSACIRSTAALVGLLGSQALKQLPCIMTHVFKKVHQVSSCPHRKFKENINEIECFIVPLFLSTLSALEAVITNLGGFLNPYLDDILDVVILHPQYVSDLDVKIKTKAAVVRKLLTDKIPARLLLPPLLKVKETALRCGEFSFSLVFEMLENMIGGMDRSSISSYHMKIYEQCLASLDIHHQVPKFAKDTNIVEQSVIQAMVVLTMKLTETMFKALFIHTLEWAESDEFKDQSTSCITIDRAISFYKLIIKLIQQHRSLFVPYFKYLLESCTRYLTEDQVVNSNSPTQKRRKTKVQDSHSHVNAKLILPTKLWHLRALILKALYHCFLYDTAETKFLDTSNFQVILKPIISQLIVEPPVIFDDYPNLPTVEEVDECLVLCLGQMAVTVKSDLLWKPLNHEVLMQTRSEKTRPKIVGLKVIKYLVEHLMEEYLTLLPETIPFLGELLEDVELPVKMLAQEILRKMEELSCESLKQYL